MSVVCRKCIEDKYLQEIAKAKGKLQKCDLCDQTRKPFTHEHID
jgi:hypothetical protein